MKGAGGGKRGGRKPTRVESDDRPRGFEAKRMRKLWDDIDHAKRKAGLTPSPAPAATAAATWDVTAMLTRASALVGDVAAWVSANAPTACAALASGAEALRAVPVVGRLVDLVPAPFTRPTDASRSGPTVESAHHRNGIVRPTVVDPGPGPDGGWVH
jgi:hypothetical protein